MKKKVTRVGPVPIPQFSFLMARGGTFLAFFLYCLFLFWPQSADAARIFLNRLSPERTQGSLVQVFVFVSSPDVAVNAVSAEIKFPPDLLELLSVQKADSILDFWPQAPIVSNKEGTVRLEGIVVDGFKGPSGEIGRLVFRARKEGAASLMVVSGDILANDGVGSKVPVTYAGTKVVITSAPTTSASVGDVSSVEEEGFSGEMIAAKNIESALSDGKNFNNILLTIVIAGNTLLALVVVFLALHAAGLKGRLYRLRRLNSEEGSVGSGLEDHIAEDKKLRQQLEKEKELVHTLKTDLIDMETRVDRDLDRIEDMQEKI